VNVLHPREGVVGQKQALELVEVVVVGDVELKILKNIDHLLCDI
jgi:hypothetical protein